MDVSFGGKIVWDPEPAADSYVVQARLPSGEILSVVSVTLTEVSVQALVASAGLSPGANILVHVASIDSFGNQGVFSSAVTFTLVAPPAPTNVRVG